MSLSQSRDGEAPETIWVGTESKVWEDHKELFHYTTKNGLEGILSSQTLFATHYAFLNDREEIIRFKRALKKLLMPKLILTIERWERDGEINKEEMERNGGFLKLCSDEIDYLIECLYKALLGEDQKPGIVTPYIFSFCSHTNDKEKAQDGLLSQWRGYGKEGGFAIVFDSKKIGELLRFEGKTRLYNPLGWGDVVYEGNEEKLQKELGEPIKILTSYILGITRARTFKETLPKARNAEFNSQAACIALYKHSGFKEENEVRIYAYCPTDNAIENAKRQGHKTHLARVVVKKNSNNKPYIELFKNLEMKLPIQKIIVGPARNKEKTAEELRKDPRLSGVEVSVSGIPYSEQGWVLETQ